MILKWWLDYNRFGLVGGMFLKEDWIYKRSHEPTSCDLWVLFCSPLPYYHSPTLYRCSTFFSERLFSRKCPRKSCASSGVCPRHWGQRRSPILMNSLRCTQQPGLSLRRNVSHLRLEKVLKGFCG